jgi:hypothetical protein
MRKQTIKEVKPDKVGDRVQRFVNRNATSIACTPDGNGTWTIVVMLPA